MVAVALNAFDYVISRRGVNYGRLHQHRTDGYWLTWGDGELETVTTIEEACAAFERITRELDGYQVSLEVRR